MSSQRIEGSHDWLHARDVQVGYDVLFAGGWFTVTHSEPTTGDSGAWMLRVATGVRYDHPDAPIAVRFPDPTGD